MNEKLFLNTLTFEYPKEAVKLYFSAKDDAERKSTRLKSPVLIPKEVKQSQIFSNLFAGNGTPTIYSSFSSPTEGFEVIALDFNEPENEYFVKRYYNRLLEKYFRYYDDVVVTKSGITDDIQVWLLANGDKKHINHDNKQYELIEMDRFTIRVKYDHYNNCPYLLVANDRPALMLNVPVARLLAEGANDPFTSKSSITPSMINKVMTREVRKGSDGTEYVVRRIDRYDYLQSHNKYCPPETTRPIMSGELKRFFLQNMGIAICAKLGGSPWLLDEIEKKELIIGIGAFRSDNQQYIGAAFSFDNTGVFNDYSYFQKSELDELVGAIKMAIIRYSAVNSQPERIIIHYYKKISRKREFKKVEDMLKSLNLNVPVFIVTINKTESEDIVLFDEESTYTSYNYQTRQNEVVKSLMPYSGKWVNLGPSKEGHRYLLCNNTRYENERFSNMDGFPFPIKLTIACPNRNDKIETPVVQQLIDQVYQFSRIYWKSVKQQGLPVTIKYPEMIAEIMPHFNDKTVYTDNNCLWFL